MTDRRIAKQMNSFIIMRYISSYLVLLLFSIFLLLGVHAKPAADPASPTNSDSKAMNGVKAGADLSESNDKPASDKRNTAVEQSPEDILKSSNVPAESNNGTLTPLETSEKGKYSQSTIEKPKGDEKTEQHENTKEEKEKEDEAAETVEEPFRQHKKDDQPAKEIAEQSEGLVPENKRVTESPEKSSESENLATSARKPFIDYASLGEATNTHFMAFLIFFSICIAVVYVGFQYKRKINAFVQDRMSSGRHSRRRRTTTARYERLNNSHPDDDEDIIY
ncbi:hypothetical protein QR680_003396 [Steinernema hermaphroditum]|uniref:Uncharacterized protein n=1 Tax=Steinernema hermaphroditum TaxID=289476 RepID=A0AA39LK54_9BILA|nr:hypothetical protein QR680_003396 [Steinernema hermaphroditum]